MLTLNFTPFPSLTTERLRLRPLRMEDAPEIFFLRSDEKINGFIDRPRAETIEDAKDFIKKIIALVQNNEAIDWAITLKDRDDLIGTICLWNISVEKETAEIGYSLLPAFQGKGLMQEAIATVIKFGFDDLKAAAITAFTHPGNNKSVELLKRNNFILDTNFEYASEEELENLACYFLENPRN